jgi:predicted KAP-like P-loop ATPase
VVAKTGARKFLSDSETIVDLLYYEAIARTVVSFVSEDPEKAVTVGVHGDWGAGKSSVLKMTEAALDGREKTLCLWFNGWVFEGFEDAKTVVLETIITETLRRRPPTQKLKAAAKKLFKRVQWLKLARKAGGLAFTAVTGIPGPELVSTLLEKAKSIAERPLEEITPDRIKALAEHAGDFLKAESTEDSIPEHIHAFRKEFEDLLDAAELDQLVVLVDDLDRCLPETAIATLEAIRLFLFVPRTAFVVGADEAMIEYSVRRHFPELTSMPGASLYARSYLEKLIQVPFRIPALGIAETRTYITLLLAGAALGETDERFKKLLSAAREDLRRPWKSSGLNRSAVTKVLGESLDPALEDAVSVSAQISPILNEGAKGNPRQVKRFLNSMALRLAIARERDFMSDVNIQVLAKLMLAERFATDFYDELARLATSSIDGKVAALARLEQGAGGISAKGKAATEKTAAAGAELDDWGTREWVSSWALIEPPLANVDLRPYVFVTRDKRSFYAGSPLSGQLDTLVERLMGSSMVVTGAIADMKKLSDPESQQIFAELKARVLHGGKFTKEPSGVQGLIHLAQQKPALQPQFLQMLKDLPIDGLGVWAATGCGLAFENTPEGKSGYQELLRTWTKQGENNALKAAADMALKVKR